jgi:hypothetical protein
LAPAARDGFARDFATGLRAAERRALVFVLAMMSSAPNLPGDTLRGRTARGQRRAEAFDPKG